MTAEIIQPFGVVRNPNIPDTDREKEALQAERELIAERLDEIAERTRRGEVDGIALVALGAEGHPELRLVTEVMFNKAATALGLIELMKHDMHMTLCFDED